MNASLVAAVAASVVALIALTWALMERRRAAAAETRNWEMRERHAETEARMRLVEDQAATQSELLRAQATQQAGSVAEGRGCRYSARVKSCPIRLEPTTVPSRDTSEPLACAGMTSCASPVMASG